MRVVKARLEILPIGLGVYGILWLIWLTGAVFLSVATGPACAADVDKYLQDDPEAPWRINADQMVYDQTTDETRATGNAVIQKKDFRLSADELRYDRNRLTGVAQGHVQVDAGGDRLSGDRMEMDLTTHTGTLYNGTLFIKKNNYHVRGEKIQKKSDNAYSAQGVQITTCDGDSPDWAITGQKLDVTLEGYGVVRHAAFRVKDIPLLYTPIFVFPAKLQRQTGLLMPEFGSSDRKGIEFIQPFFWAINDHSDATIYAHYMDRRGSKLGVEYRYMLGEDAMGTLMFDGFDDRKTDDGSGTTSKDYGYTDDTALRPNSDRYWFRMKHDQPLPYGLTAQLDLDVVSDQDYLYEFKSGYTGFAESERYFERYFGRDLDDYTDPVRTNRLNLNRLWSRFALNTEFRWMDDVVKRRQEAVDDTCQRLPSIFLDSTRQAVFNTPLFFDLDSQYAYFYREDGTRGHRTDIHPRIYLPFRLGSYLSVEPSAGARETVWHLDKFADFDGDTDRTLHRELYDFRLDLSSEVYHIYHTDAGWADRLKHLMRFQMVYDYVPHLSQDDYPEFDYLDRIDNAHRLTYSWTHSFVSRTPIHAPGADASLPEVSAFRYNQLGRFKLEQSYDIYKEDKGLAEPFSPLTAEVEFDLIPGVYVQADAGWSTYDSEFVSHNIACRLSDRRGDNLVFERRYSKGERESIYMDLLLQATPWLWFYGNYERNLLTRKDLDKGVGISFRARCWSFDVQYSKEEDDEKIAFTISLFGLGDIGSGTRKTGRTQYFERLETAY